MRTINGFAIDSEPFSDRLQAFNLGGRHIALRVRADVQQVIASLARDVDQVAKQSLGGLEVHVV